MNSWYDTQTNFDVQSKVFSQAYINSRSCLSNLESKISDETCLDTPLPGLAALFVYTIETFLWIGELIC